MKKIICLWFLMSFYSASSYALHGAGVTQDFDTGEVTNVSGSFLHTGDSQVQLPFDYETNTDTLTINDFFVSGINFDSYTWDLVTGLSIQSDCVISGAACDGVFSSILELQNTDISRIGGSNQFFFNDVSGEGGDLFFIDSVIIDTDILVSGNYAATINVSSVPLPGSIVLFISGLVFLTRITKKKHI